MKSSRDTFLEQQEHEYHKEEKILQRMRTRNLHILEGFGDVLLQKETNTKEGHNKER